jgi:AAA15 family ATPase/GTPase
MFQSLSLSNFACFANFDWQQHQKFNVIIGANDTGKTYILKILYTLAKSCEEYQKRQLADKPDFSEVLATKLYWVFQPENGLGDLVKKGQKQLEVTTQFCHQDYRFSLANDATKTINQILGQPSGNQGFNTIFIPPKEVLTAFEAIAALYEQLKIFGFDDTYQDLIKALRFPVSQADINPNFLKIAQQLEQIYQGKIVYHKQRFIFEKHDNNYGMSQTAEGVKKLSIVSLLIRNHMIRENTIMLIDEPEVNLHPFALQEMLKALVNLSQIGVTIYLATHSYTVIKQLEILAKKYQQDILLCSLLKTDNITAEFSNLLEGMPDNPILDAVLKLYEEDVKLELEA